jgi:hypothetical protein
MFQISEKENEGRIAEQMGFLTIFHGLSIFHLIHDSEVVPCKRQDQNGVGSEKRFIRF